MSRPQTVVVLCEDKMHAFFAQRFLKMTRKKWRVKTITSPPGEGSAEQYVRKQYPIQLEAARESGFALIVMTDGDNLGIDERKRQLQSECNKRKVETRGDGEAVAILVPEPNIEAWIHHLGVGNIERPKDCLPAVGKLAKLCARGNDAPDGFPPSLKDACGEWQQFA